MRHLIAAALLLSPVFVHAQTAAPSNAANLEARVSDRAFPLDGARVTPAALKITTGLTAPKILHTVAIDIKSDELDALSSSENKAVVSFLVGEDGIARDVRIVKSLDRMLDARVVAAVKQYRFQPGQLDHQPVAVPVTLEILFRQ